MAMNSWEWRGGVVVGFVRMWVKAFSLCTQLVFSICKNLEYFYFKMMILVRCDIIYK